MLSAAPYWPFVRWMYEKTVICVFSFKNNLFFALFSRIIGIFANPLFLREETDY